MSDISGFVVLHRKLLDWEWYDDANVMRLFLHGILKANHAPKKWRAITVQRGQFVSSYDTLAQELGLTKKQIRLAQEKLEGTGEWAHDGHTQFTVFTVKNYNLYQDKGTPKEQPAEQPRAFEGTSEGSKKTPNNNDNNDNNETNIPIALPKPTRKAKKQQTEIDPELTLSEKWRELANGYWKQNSRPDLNADNVFIKFRSHHVSKGLTSADWQASWTTWYCNAIPFNPPPLQVVPAPEKQTRLLSKSGSRT